MAALSAPKGSHATIKSPAAGRLYDLSTPYGNKEELKNLLKALREAGIKSVGDVVSVVCVSTGTDALPCGLKSSHVTHYSIGVGGSANLCSACRALLS